MVGSRGELWKGVHRLALGKGCNFGVASIAIGIQSSSLHTDKVITPYTALFISADCRQAKCKQSSVYPGDDRSPT